VARDFRPPPCVLFATHIAFFTKKAVSTLRTRAIAETATSGQEPISFTKGTPLHTAKTNILKPFETVISKALLNLTPRVANRRLKSRKATLGEDAFPAPGAQSADSPVRDV